MAHYLTSYNLFEKSDYKELYDELEAYNAVQIVETVWYFNRQNTNVVDICLHFKSFIGKDDCLFVSEINEWAAYKTDNQPIDEIITEEKSSAMKNTMPRLNAPIQID